MNMAPCATDGVPEVIRAGQGIEEVRHCKGGNPELDPDTSAWALMAPLRLDEEEGAAGADAELGERVGQGMLGVQRRLAGKCRFKQSRGRLVSARGAGL